MWGLQLYLTQILRILLNDLSIAATLFALGSALGFGLGGWISDGRGKRLTMFASNLAAYACWVVTALAGTRWLLFASYSLQGFFGAIAYNCIGDTKLVMITLVVMT